MTSEKFYFIQRLDTGLEIPEGGSATRTVFQDDHVKVVLFGFAPGQGLKEHKAPMPIIIQFLQGEGSIVLGDETRDFGAGTWIRCETGLSHSIASRTRTVMLLTLLKSGKPSSL